MSLIQQTIASLVAGISQQSPTLRKSSQVETLENGYPTIVDGLKKRPAAHFVQDLGAAPLVNPHVHFIHRDNTEKYAVVLSQGAMKVFDVLSGQEQVVNYPHGTDYIGEEFSSEDFRLVTVQDYTFVVNKTVPVRSGFLPARTDEAMTAKVNFTNPNNTWAFGIYIPRVFTGYSPLLEANPNMAPEEHGRFFFSTNMEGILQIYREQIEACIPLTVGWRWAPNSYYHRYRSIDEVLSEDPIYEIALAEADKNAVNRYFSIQSTSDYGATFDNPVGICQNQTGNQASGQSKLLVNTLDENNAQRTYMGTRWNDVQILSGEYWPPGFVAHLPALGYECVVFMFKPGDTATQYLDHPGGWETLRLYPSYPYVQSWNPAERRGIQVNGYWIGEPGTNLVGTDLATAYASAISARVPGLATNAAGYSLTITGASGIGLFVSPSGYEKGALSVEYVDSPLLERLFVIVTNGVAEQTYRLSLDGQSVAYTTGDTTQYSTYRIDTIVNNLASQVNNLTGYTAKTYGSFLVITKGNFDPIDFDCSDTWGDQAMKAMKNRVEEFTELPAKFISGVPIQVGTDAATSYWVHYVTASTEVELYAPVGELADSSVVTRQLNTKSKMSQPQTEYSHSGWNALESEENGVWEECPAPKAKEYLVPETMPHVLIRQANGEFTFSPISWAGREVGDTVTVPTPSFVENPVSDLFFYRNRLGILVGESVVLSKAGEFFNFWPTTAKDVLDSDPLDLMVSHTKVATLRHTAVFNSQMLLFADSTQFSVNANGALTPKTVFVQPVTEFPCDALVKPVAVGRTLFFTAPRGKFSTVFEYEVMPDRYQNTATDITSHVPKFVPSPIRELSGCGQEDLLTMTAGNDLTKLYVQKSYWAGDQKAQEAWCYWQFPFDILGHTYMDSTMYAVVKLNGRLMLTKLKANLGETDGDMDYEALLDAKVFPTGAWDGTHTTWTLPYDHTGYTIGALATVGYDEGGQVVTVEKTGTNTVRAVGNWTDNSVALGIPYVLRCQLSQVYVRDQEDAVKQNYKVQLLHMRLRFHKTHAFSVEVTPKHRATQHYVWPRADLVSYVEQGDDVGMSWPVMARGEEVTIELVNDTPQQSNWLSIEWSGNGTKR